MAGAQLLTLPEASRALGFADAKGRRLRRVLIAHESVTGSRVGVLVGRGRKAAWRVSLAAAREVLRSHGLLEGGDRLDRLGREVRANLAGLDERIDARAEVVATRVVGRARRDLEARDEQVMAEVVEVSRALRRVALAAGVAGSLVSRGSAPASGGPPPTSPVGRGPGAG